MTKESGFRNLLRKSGYKATPSRLAILGVLKNTRRPMSAQEVIEALSCEIDQATVYRTFKSLQEKGIIKPIDLRHNHAHYELANLADHHHLICTYCGKVEDVHHCGVEDIQLKVLRSSRYFSTITQHALEFYGMCKTCAHKKT